jgi:class 3 adenylate cyclase
MTSPAPRPPARTVVVADDDAARARDVKAMLEQAGYALRMAASAADARAVLDREKVPPSVVIASAGLKDKDAFELCKEIHRRYPKAHVPVLVITGQTASAERALGLQAGADDFLSSPVQAEELLARVKSLARVHDLHLALAAQATQLEGTLKELERLEQLKRFFSPQIVAVATSESGQALMKSHRRDVTVMFLDLRGFTAFAEAAAPERVTDVLHEYYTCAGNVALAHGATLGKLSGDGMMFFFNDPVEMKNHQEKAVEMGLALRTALGVLREKWHKQGNALDFGVGIASGYAMIGRFGFERYSEYTVIGTVANLAARLCGEAAKGQILIEEYFLVALGERFEAQVVGPMYLKGLPRTVNAYNIIKMK